GMGKAIKANVTTFFKEQLLDSIKCDVVKGLFKLVVRVICYGILFCSCPGVLTGACVATLIAMDLSTVDGLSKMTKDLLSAMLEGDLFGAAGAMSDIIYLNNPDREYMVKETTRELKSFLGEFREPQ
nr:2B [potamipivirus A1]